MIEVVSTECLCPPDASPEKQHMCVHRASHWLRGPDGWYRVHSRRVAERWLALCNTWDDVLAVAWELRLDGPFPSTEGS